MACAALHTPAAEFNSAGSVRFAASPDTLDSTAPLGADVCVAALALAGLIRITPDWPQTPLCHSGMRVSSPYRRKAVWQASKTVQAETVPQATAHLQMAKGARARPIRKFKCLRQPSD